MLSQDRKPKPEKQEEAALPIFEAGDKKTSSKKGKLKEKIQNVTERSKKKKASDGSDLVVSAPTKTNKEKTVFIVCACLLSPLALLLALIIVAFFLALLAAILLLAGALTIVLIALAIVGAILAVVGIVYGAILLFTGEGIEVLAGQYELGIGITITGITVILSVLLYSGITELVPFLIKKTGAFFAFTFKKIKKLAVYIYRRSTGI